MKIRGKSWVAVTMDDGAIAAGLTRRDVVDDVLRTTDRARLRLRRRAPGTYETDAGGDRIVWISNNPLWLQANGWDHAAHLAAQRTPTL